MNKSRLETFSDGVLAIIITIMVLEFKTPASTEWESIKPLLGVLGSYALSFVFIGTYWGNHHHLLYSVKKVNSKIILANLHLLFWVSLIPFATKWMAEHNDKIAVASYGALLLLCGFAYNVLQQMILRSHTFNIKMKLAMKKQSVKGVISLVGFIVSIPVAFLNPVISEIIFVGINILWVIPDKNIENALEE